MTYNINIPAPNDLLSDSQLDIQQNFLSANTSFGINHYPFSDTTINAGKHNVITTPIITPLGHPTTAADEPKMYSMKDTNNLGVLNYSRGPSDARPTPLTSKHSTFAAVTIDSVDTITIMDFTGIKRCFGTLYVSSYSTNLAFTVANFSYSQTSRFNFEQEGTRSGSPQSLNLEARNTSSELKVFNKTGSPVLVYWTLVLHRIDI